jgi:hypothetical protein
LAPHPPFRRTNSLATDTHKEKLNADLLAFLQT